MTGGQAQRMRSKEGKWRSCWRKLGGKARRVFFFAGSWRRRGRKGEGGKSWREREGRREMESIELIRCFPLSRSFDSQMIDIEVKKERGVRLPSSPFPSLLESRRTVEADRPSLAGRLLSLFFYSSSLLLLTASNSENTAHSIPTTLSSSRIARTSKRRNLSLSEEEMDSGKGTVRLPSSSFASSLFHSLIDLVSCGSRRCQTC